jgi:hypothetical protein
MFKYKEWFVILLSVVFIVFPFVTGCPALHYNEMLHYLFATVKCTGETDTFSNSGPHKVYVLSTSPYGHN